MLAMIIHDDVAEYLGIAESDMIGKVTNKFEQLEDGSYMLYFDDDEYGKDGYHFGGHEIHVITILHNDKGIDPMKHLKVKETYSFVKEVES